MRRTDRSAFATGYTAILVKQHLGIPTLAFGIVAPQAAQIAPFEKYSGTDPRTVHVGAALDIKNDSFHFGHTGIFCSSVIFSAHSRAFSDSPR